MFKSIETGRPPRTEIAEVDIPDSVLVKFDNLIENINIQIWNRLSFGWHKGFEKLKKYVTIHGHARVPLRYKDPDGFALGRWGGSRRENYKQGHAYPG